jgi:adenylate kinase
MLNPPAPLRSAMVRLRISVACVRLLLVAYPGAGKGTQAMKLSAHYGIQHLSSGALLRDEVTRGTRIGLLASTYLDRGDLVPDELVFEMLAAPVLEAVHAGGYVLDGYPRTVRQAEEAYALAQRLDGIELQAVVYLRVSNDELNRRLFARADREGRSDDTETGIAHRFEIFDAQTRPLLRFYAERGILLEINGEQRVEDVFGDITSAIASLVVGLEDVEPRASG